MSYTIRLQVIQKEPTKWFRIVENTVWHFAQGGTWAEYNGEHTLTMGGSGTSGTLRFKNPQGEYFLVALGVHNYKHWCDILPDLSSFHTGMQIHPEYYDDGKHSDEVSKQAGEVEKKTTKGATITVKYYKEEGHTLYAKITIN